MLFENLFMTSSPGISLSTFVNEVVPRYNSGSILLRLFVPGKPPLSFVIAFTWWVSSWLFHKKRRIREWEREKVFSLIIKKALAPWLTSFWATLSRWPYYFRVLLTTVFCALNVGGLWWMVLWMMRWVTHHKEDLDELGTQVFATAVWLERMLRCRADPTNVMIGGDYS